MMIDCETYYTAYNDGAQRFPITIKIAGPDPLSKDDVTQTLANLFDIPGEVTFQFLFRVLVPLAFRLLIKAARL